MQRLTNALTHTDGIARQALLMSRIFCRVKSADSILEKIKRKGIFLDSLEQIPTIITDILGFRVIVDTPLELQSLDQMISQYFEVTSRLDEANAPKAFGSRGIEYSLRYHVNGVACPFELQARTFLQHYWASRTFHLFHKRPAEVAEQYRDVLCELNKVLHHAEEIAAKIKYPESFSSKRDHIHLNATPLWARLNLIVVGKGERFLDRLVMILTGDDRVDNDTIVAHKVALYRDNEGAAIVECCCQNLSTFMLNEPHVMISPDHLLKFRD